MNPKDILELGNRYTKKDLSSLLEQENIALVREGICYLKDFPASLFFVDLDKTDKKEESLDLKIILRVSFLLILQR